MAKVNYLAEIGQTLINIGASLITATGDAPVVKRKYTRRAKPVVRRKKARRRAKKVE